MLTRSRSRFRGRAQPTDFLELMSFYGATDAWDFTTNTYLRGGIVGPSGITFTRASVGYAERSNGIWQSFASGVARITDKGFLIEASRINRALYSRDLTNAAWTATNVTVARNQIGIDGTANSACSLTATAGNGTVLQAITHASTARYFSIWVKRITGTGTVNVTLDNGTTWTAVTVTSVWTRVGAAQTLANPTVGVRLVTSGDAIAVDFAQLEDGGFPSSPILVEGTAVTRAADVATVTLSALTSGYSMFAEWAQSQNGSGRILDFGGSTLIRRSGGIVFTANGAGLEGQIVNAATAGKGAIAIDAAAIRIALNGTQPGSYSGSYSASPQTALRLASTGSANFLDGYLARVAVISVALSNAQLQAITT